MAIIITGADSILPIRFIYLPKYLLIITKYKNIVDMPQRGCSRSIGVSDKKKTVFRLKLRFLAIFDLIYGRKYDCGRHITHYLNGTSILRNGQ